MNITFHAHTDVGRKRSENQDSYGILEDDFLYIVCDGMGGGAAGDFASRAAVQVLLKAFGTLTPADISSVIPNANQYSQPSQRVFASIRLANRALHNLAIKYPKLRGMGTTIVAALADKPRNLLHIFHVGDSRLYRLRGQKMDLLTYDHSKVNELIEQGKMTEAEAKHSEIQSMITRALGTQPVVRIDYKVVPVQEGDCFVLCTDGLNGEIDDAMIHKIFFRYHSTLNELCTKLVEAANTAGGRDNTTVVALCASNIGPAEPDAEYLMQEPNSVYSIEAETPDETEAEDAILRNLIRSAGIQIPKSANDSSLFSNPMVLGLIFAVSLMLVGGLVSMLISHAGKPRHDKELVGATGKVCGLSIDTRTPTPDQYRSYKASDDPIVRMQLIQDWYRDPGANTVPLDGVAVTIGQSGVIASSGTINGKPCTVQLAPGNYELHLALPDYKVINERLESGNTFPLTAEYSQTTKSLMLIMIPE